MKKSKKNISRSHIRKRSKLRKQRDRIVERGKGKYVQEEFSLTLFFKKHRIDVFFIVVLIFVILAIRMLGPDKKMMNNMRDSMSAMVEDQSQYWQDIYPDGYKIIAFTDQDIIHTNFDTLPEDLVINWKELSVVRVQANRFENTDEKLKISLEGVNYVSAGVFDRTLIATFTRKKGMSSTLAQFGELNFVAQIIEDNGEQLFVLLGLRGR